MNKKGYFYCGFYPNQRKNGVFKIGETMMAPSSRQASIAKSSGKDFAIIKYISIPEITKEELLLIESVVRFKLSRSGMAKYMEEKNDHFAYNIINKESVLTITNFCIECAEQVLQEQLECIDYKIEINSNYVKYFW